LISSGFRIFWTNRYFSGTPIRLKPSGELYRNAFDGRIKQLLTHLLLKERKNNPDLFHYGDYIPLQCSGKYKENIMAFIRKRERHWLLVFSPCIPVLCRHGKEADYLSASSDWKDTWLTCPREHPGNGKNIFTGEIQRQQPSLEVGELIRELPVASFNRQNGAFGKASRASCFMFLPCPGKFGTGDFGPAGLPVY
jgi:maltooligosyltrehalose synthase